MVNKQELINRIVENTGMTKKSTRIFLDAFIDEISEALANDEIIRLHGFISMETVNVDDTIKTNPQNQEPIEVPAHKKVRIKAGEGLRNFINNN